MNHLLLFCLIGFAGMLVQSFVGFAGSLLAVPLFAMFLSPRDAVPAFNIAGILVEAVLVFESRQHVQWSRIWRLLAGALIGTSLGACALKWLPVQAVTLFISVTTVAFAILFLLDVRLPLKENAPTQLSVGLFSGLLGGSISIPGPPIVIYGLARRWDKNAFRTTLLTYFLVLSLVATVWYAILHLYTARNLELAAAAAPPMLAAGWLGVVFKDRASERFFRSAVLTAILLTGILAVGRYL